MEMSGEVFGRLLPGRVPLRLPSYIHFAMKLKGVLIVHIEEILGIISDFLKTISKVYFHKTHVI